MSFVLLFIVISPVAGGILTRCGRYIYALIVSDRARQLTVALGIKIDELRHCRQAAHQLLLDVVQSTQLIDLLRRRMAARFLNSGVLRSSGVVPAA